MNCEYDIIISYIQDHECLLEFLERKKYFEKHLEFAKFEHIIYFFEKKNWNTTYFENVFKNKYTSKSQAHEIVNKIKENCKLKVLHEYTDNFKYNMIRYTNLQYSVLLYDILIYFPECLSDSTFQFGSFTGMTTLSCMKVKNPKWDHLDIQIDVRPYNLFLGFNYKIPDLLYKIAEISGIQNFNGISVWSPEIHINFSYDFQNMVNLFLWGVKGKKYQNM